MSLVPREQTNADYREGLEAGRAEGYVPGLWRCAKCKLDLTASVLCVGNGELYANTKPQDCPNGCGPMWRVSERDERKDAQRSYCDLWERAERMRQHILTKVVGRLVEPGGRFVGEWGCGLCGGVGKGPANGTRDLESIQHADDCMARPLHHQDTQPK